MMSGLVESITIVLTSATSLNVVPNSANKPQSLSSHSAILPAGASDYYKFSLTAKNLNWTFATDSTTDTVMPALQ